MARPATLSRSLVGGGPWGGHGSAGGRRTGTPSTSTETPPTIPKLISGERRTCADECEADDHGRPGGDLVREPGSGSCGGRWDSRSSLDASETLIRGPTESSSLRPRLPLLVRRKSMGFTRDTLKGSPEVRVETRGTIRLVVEAEPDSQALPAEIAIRGLFGWRCGRPGSFLRAARL